MTTDFLTAHIAIQIEIDQLQGINYQQYFYVIIKRISDFNIQIILTEIYSFRLLQELLEKMLKSKIAQAEILVSPQSSYLI